MVGGVDFADFIREGLEIKSPKGIDWPLRLKWISKPERIAGLFSQVRLFLTLVHVPWATLARWDKSEDVDPDEVTAGLESAASALAQRSARLVKSRYVASGLSMQPWYKERIFTKAHSIELMADACALARAPSSFTLKEILPLHQAVIDAAKAIKHLLANDGRRDVALDLMLEHSAGWSCGKGGPSPRIGDIGTEAFLTRCLG